MATLHYEAPWYIWRGSFEERSIPKDAGFTWSDKSWRTTNDFIAWKLQKFAVDEALERFQSFNRKLKMSRALALPAEHGAIHLRTQNLKDMEPLSFQDVPVAYVNGLNHILIGDDPGLGKTVEAIKLLNHWVAGSTLIICPANKRDDWADALNKWRVDKYPCRIMYGRKDVQMRSVKNADRKCQNDIVSFALLSELNMENRYDCVVIDEVQYCKNPDASRTRLALGFAQSASHSVALSGTFPPNNAAELWSYLNALQPSAIDNMPFSEYTNRFCHIRMWNDTPAPYGVKNGRELQFRLRNTCMVRRRIIDALPQLKQPELRIIELANTEHIQRIVDRENHLNAVHGLVDEHGDIQGAGGNEFTKLRRLMAIEMVPRIVEYAQLILRQEQKLLIVGWHTDALEAICEKLHGFSPVLIHGRVSGAKKHKLKEQFQHDDSVRVCVGNIQSCGVGIDMTAARRGIVSEPSWNPGDNRQVIGRLNRFGQVKRPRFDFLVAQGSLNARVLSRALEKQEDVDTILDEDLGVEIWESN